MAYQYSPEQLQHLRASPLVQKPATLPPAEEWMGPSVDPTQKRTNTSRGKFEAGIGHSESARVTLDNRHSAKVSGSGDIVLGPPKTAFASASSAFRGTSSESPGRSAFGSFAADARGDYFTKGRPGLERGKSDFQDERFKESKGGFHRNGREDALPWLSREKSSRFDNESTARGLATHDAEPDADGTARKQHFRGFDSQRRDNTRELEDSKRTGESRGTRPSWYQDDDSNDNYIRDNNGDALRSRGWRSGERGDRVPRGGTDRDWTRDTRTEQEPEWMGDLKPEQKREKHSAQDIEQWKANMKAREASSTHAEPTSVTPHTRTSSGTLQNRTKAGVPLSVNPTLDDKFLSFFGDTNGIKPVEQKTTEEALRAGTGRANPKLSKFTGFFGPQTAPTPPSLESKSTATAAPTYGLSEPVNEDKAGFQRILQMLGAPQPPVVQQGDAAYTRSPSPPQGNQASLFTTHSPPPILSPRSRKSHGLEGLLGMQSPKEPAVTMNKDSEFLLNLLRPKENGDNQPTNHEQRRREDKPTPAPQMDGFPGESFRPGPHHPYDVEPQQARYLNEPDLVHGRYQDKHAVPPSQNQPLHGPSQFDDGDDGSVFPPHFTLGIPSQHAHPPGLHRPPGFDNPGPPPGFAQFISAQQQHQRGLGVVAPPPGFAAPPSRNNSQQQFPPGLMPNLGNLSMDDRGQPYSTRHIGPGPGPGPGPGLVPNHGGLGNSPPGFAGLPGPPPGSIFPSMMIPPENLYGPARHFADPGDPGQFRAAGRGGPPTAQFRRQE